MKPQVFISHTDRDDRRAATFRDKLAQGLHDEGFAVYLDERRLELGAEWRKTLYREMLRSRAGLILVSERALAGTDWMRFEATVLLMLRTASLVANEQGRPRPAFPLIPVVLPPVGIEQLADSWLGPLALDEIQGGRADAKLVKRIAASLQPLHEPEPASLTGLKRAIRAWLRDVDADTLRGAAQAVGAPADIWRDDELLDRLTTELLTADLGRVEVALEQLRPWLNDRDAGQLLDMLCGGWVDVEAAAKLPPLAWRDGRRAVAINGEYTAFTARSYVQCAWPRYPAMNIVCPTEHGELDAEGYANEIVAGIRASAGLESDDEVPEFVERRTRDRPVLVALKGWPEPQTVDALTARFPKVTLIFLSGSDVPPAEQRRGLEYLEPAVTPAHESDAYYGYANARMSLGIGTGRRT